jgi:hypothetical protein
MKLYGLDSFDTVQLDPTLNFIKVSALTVAKRAVFNIVLVKGYYAMYVVGTASSTLTRQY